MDKLFQAIRLLKNSWINYWGEHVETCPYEQKTLAHREAENIIFVRPGTPHDKLLCESAGTTKVSCPNTPLYWRGLCQV